MTTSDRTAGPVGAVALMPVVVITIRAGLEREGCRFRDALKLSRPPNRRHSMRSVAQRRSNLPLA